MRKSLFFLTIAIFPFFAHALEPHPALPNPSGDSVDDYLTLLRTHGSIVGPKGNAEKGEIEIITDPETIRKMEKETKRTVGVAGYDRYWLILNDPVLFPSGAKGIYSRVFWNRAIRGYGGVAILPVDSKRGIAYLICNYRHATRSWELELPRGAREIGESIENAAIRETSEETGLIIKHVETLGHMAPDTGNLTSITPVVMAEVEGIEEASPEDAEAIAGVVALPFSTVCDAIQRGTIELTIQGERKKVPVRDSFLSYALLQYLLKNR